MKNNHIIFILFFVSVFFGSISAMEKESSNNQQVYITNATDYPMLINIKKSDEIDSKIDINSYQTIFIGIASDIENAEVISVGNIYNSSLSLTDRIQSIKKKNTGIYVFEIKLDEGYVLSTPQVGQQATFINIPAVPEYVVPMMVENASDKIVTIQYKERHILKTVILQPKQQKEVGSLNLINDLFIKKGLSLFQELMGAKYEIFSKKGFPGYVRFTITYQAASQSFIVAYKVEKSVLQAAPIAGPGLQITENERNDLLNKFLRLAPELFKEIPPQYLGYVKNYLKNNIPGEKIRLLLQSKPEEINVRYIRAHVWQALAAYFGLKAEIIDQANIEDMFVVLNSSSKDEGFRPIAGSGNNYLLSSLQPEGRTPEAIRQLKRVYKIHLMPQDQHMIDTFIKLLSWLKEPEFIGKIKDQQAQRYAALRPHLLLSIKLYNDFERVSVDQAGNVIPKIVLYSATKFEGKNNEKAQALLNDVYYSFNTIAGSGEIPRFSQPVTSLISFTQGNGDDKRKEQFNEFFEQPDMIYYSQKFMGMSPADYKLDIPKK